MFLSFLKSILLIGFYIALPNLPSWLLLKELIFFITDFYWFISSMAFCNSAILKLSMVGLILKAD
jgi:hypothetical protein